MDEACVGAAMTYEYECTACHHTWEAEQKITDKPLIICPKCAKNKKVVNPQTAKRLISGKGAFVLNGEGWFKSGGY
jgi:putative FmdB family regulatory protein